MPKSSGDNMRAKTAVISNEIAKDEYLAIAVYIAPDNSCLENDILFVIFHFCILHTRYLTYYPILLMTSIYYNLYC